MTAPARCHGLGRALFTAAAVALAAPASAATVAEWIFSEAPGRPGVVADRSGHAHDLTVAGDPPRVKFETVDGSPVLTLAGAHGWTKDRQFAITASILAAAFDPAKGFTFEMRFTPGAGFIREGDNTLFSQGATAAGPGFVIKLFYDRLVLEPGAAAKAGGRREAATQSEAWTPGVWYHVAVVDDGTRCAMHVDGLKAAETASTGPLPVAGATYFVGSALGGHANGFNGSIAWARLSDEPLSGRAIVKSARDCR